MLLHTSTWQEVQGYLESSTAVIVPIGSTEQHGPNGLIGTDAICPETIAAEVGRQTGTLIAPTLSIGVAQHHMAFPGTITLRPPTLIAVIADVVDSLVRHGFERLYFLNGHGGNIATISAAFSESYGRSSLGDSRRTPFRLRLRNWWHGPDLRRLSSQLYGKAEGSHATPSEVSLSWFACPDAVKDVPMSPEIAPTGEIRDAEDYRRQFPDGRIGSNPALASVEAGERLLHAAVADTIADLQGFVGGK